MLVCNSRTFPACGIGRVRGHAKSCPWDYCDKQRRIDVQRRGDPLGRPTTPDNHPKGPKPNSLGAIIGSYKSAVSNRIHKEHNATGIWQRNYYEHIIRDEKDLQNKTDYILANPSLWDKDDENSVNVKSS